MEHKQREYQRVYLTFYLRVFCKNKFVGFLIDVSQEGIMLMSESLIKEGKKYDFQLKLPSSVEWKSKSVNTNFINFTAKCKWSKNDETDSEFYISGYEFTIIDQKNKTIIQDIIEEYKLQ